MLRDDERTAWQGFLSAEPRFAGEELASDGDGPDPPDVLCVGKSGKRIGVELTKWVEHEQISDSMGRKLLEDSYLRVLKSETEPRPDRIGKVLLHDKSKRLKPEHESQFRSELFALLEKENATPNLPDDLQGPPTAVPPWNTPQGAPIKDFTGYPMLAEYLDDVWILPRQRFPYSSEPWVMFELRGGAFTPDWMVEAAIDRIRDKIRKYEHANLRRQHSLTEFDLLCFYCDEAMLHNTPIHGIDFGFPQLATKVAEALAHEPKVFDSIFLYHPHEGRKGFRVYPRLTTGALLRRVLKTFATGFFATAKEKWIEGGANLALIVWLFLSKPASVWEVLAPFLWLWAFICAMHIVRATVKILSETSNPPEAASNFRFTLSGFLVGFLLLLASLSYGVRRAEVASVRTFAYLAPTAELMECQKRAFFVKIVGPRSLSRVEVALRDNKSGQRYVQSFAEIDPGPLRTDQYLWFAPAAPWNEDYTVTLTSKESHSSQRLIVGSAHHQIQFATQVTVEDEASPALSCRDNLLASTYSLASAETRSCVEPMRLAEDATSALDVYSYQRPDGSVTVRHMRALPPPSELDEQSDQRHLTEYQKQLLRSVLKRYAGSRLRIFYAGGDNSLAYAEEWRQLFAESWETTAPSLVPVGDERIIDVQITIGNKQQEPEAKTLLDVFQSAGIKHRKFFSIDPAADDDVVLWVGPKSPKDASPDQCSSPELKPTQGVPHVCDLIAQSGGICPFVPE